MTDRPPETTWLPYGLLAVAVCALVLGVLALVSRRSAGALPSRDGYFAEWSRVHGGFRPTGLVAWWLRGVYVLARPLARAGVSPSALTAFGVVTAGLVPCLAVVGQRWPIAAGLVVAVSAGLDNLDGAVAVLCSRTTSWGFLLDSLVDRVADVLYLLTFWLLGAAGWLVALAAGALLLLEYARARAGNAGLGEIGVVTVGERPTRVIIASSFLITAGVFCGHAADVAALGALATVGVSAVGLAQFLVVARRKLDR